MATKYISKTDHSKAGCMGLPFCVSFRYIFRILLAQFATAILAIIISHSLGVVTQAKGQSLVTVKMNHIADATHFEFYGRKNWDYSFEKSEGNRMVLKVPALGPESIARITKWTGPFIKNITVNNSSSENGYTNIEFNLKNAKVENFDYMTDKPSRVIIDFYSAIENLKKVALPKSKANVVTSNASSKNKIKIIKPQRQAKQGYKIVDRRPAGSEFIKLGSKNNKAKSNSLSSVSNLKGAYDGADPEFQRFWIKDYEVDEKAIIKSKRNIYIRFPVLKMNTNHLKKIVAEIPEYVIKDGHGSENREARFLQLLWQKNRQAKFMKVYDHFKKNYPDSKYMEIVDHLSAEMHLAQFIKTGNRNHESKFKQTFKSLLSRFPKSQLNERIHLILAYSSMSLGVDIETARRFNEFISTYPISDKLDNARIALADGLTGLKDYAGGLAVYKSIQETSKNYKKKAESKFREGDVFFVQNKFKKTIASYSRAIKAYPKFRGIFPNAEYGMAESLFWLGRYRESLNGHIKFLQNFPEHAYGGYSMTRIGELLDILGADTSRSMMAFLESYYRYRENPGAKVARIRLLSHRMKGMKDKQFINAINEIEEASNTSKLPLMTEFATLLVSDGLYFRKEYDKSLMELIKFYQQHQESNNLPYFHKRIVKNIATKIRDYVGESNFLAALKLHKKYSATWLLKSDRIDIPFFVARAYELAGVEWEAELGYKSTLARFSQIEGTREQKIREVNEFLPARDSVRLRLAAIFVRQKQFIEGEKVLHQIVDSDTLNDEDRIEYKVLQSNLALFRGQSNQARRHLRELINTWKGQPQKLTESYYKLAKLEFNLQKYEKADKNIILAEQAAVGGADGSEEWQGKILQLKGEVAFKIGEKIEAVRIFVGLLEKFPNLKGGEALRYRAGNILFNQGDINGAKKIWSPLQAKDSSVYANLIKENIESTLWERNLKKYINRIPAVSKN